MSVSVVLRSAGDALNAYGRNPLFLLPALFLFLALALFRKISLVVLPQLQTTIANVLWTLVAALLLLAFVALASAALLALAADIARQRKPEFQGMFRAMRRFFVPLFGIFLVVRVASALLFFLALGAGDFVLDVLDWGNNAAFVAAFTVALLGFAGGLLFLAFAPAACVLYNQGIWASICTSVFVVRKHYGSLLVASAIVSLLVFLIGRFLPDLAAELVKSLVLLPLLALYLCFMLARLGGTKP